jgi:hypothetical protein
VRREAVEGRRDHLVDQRARAEGEQYLAGRGAVHRHPAGHPGRLGHLAVAGHLLQVEDFPAVGDGEVDRLVRGLVEVLHVRPGGVAQDALAGDPLADFEQADAEPVVAAAPLQHAPGQHLLR